MLYKQQWVIIASKYHRNILWANRPFTLKLNSFMFYFIYYNRDLFMRDKINTNSILPVSYFTHVDVYTSDKCLQNRYINNRIVENEIVIPQ